MRIAIDARWIFAEISGIGAYTRELIHAIAHTDTKNTYILIFCEESLLERTLDETATRGRSNVVPIRVPYGVFSVANQLLLPGVLKHYRVDIYHSTNYMIPFMAFPLAGYRHTCCVTTVHDVIPLLMPESIRRSRKARVFWIFKRIMMEVGMRSDIILTDSEASRADVIRCLKIPPAQAPKVRSIHCGIQERFLQTFHQRRSDDPARPRRLLYVGRADPYKNLAVAVKALAEARRLCPFPVVLVVAGSPDPRYMEPRRLAAKLGVADAVEWTGYLSDQHLLEHYREADLMIHPSRYEGFGLQVAEAMAVGLPVICSRGGSLPEVAGDAAIFCDADDVAGFAGAIHAVLTDPARARDMAERGRRQAARFSWAATAAKTLAVYGELAERAADCRRLRRQRITTGGHLLRIIVGWVIIIVGIADLPLPGPGTLIIMLGVLMLAPYVRFFRWLSTRTQRTVPAIRKGIRNARRSGFPLP
jgi:alpha-1,3-rhamnosyl/mannosyltransferase